MIRVSKNIRYIWIPDILVGSLRLGYRQFGREDRIFLIFLAYLRAMTSLSACRLAVAARHSLRARPLCLEGCC